MYCQRGIYNLVLLTLFFHSDALGLDIHHMVEQLGRASLYKVFGFNGSGGIWRKRAIEDAGGFTWDTVTEDIYLAYQSHLKGYDFLYVRDFPQLLEVPSGILAHIQQKQRWSKGFLQVFRLHYMKIMRSPSTSWTIKFEMLIHVLAPVQFVVVLLGLLVYPYVATSLEPHTAWLLTWSIVIGSLEPLLESIHAIFFKVSGSNGHYNTLRSRFARLVLIAPYYSLRLGLAVFEGKAVIEGLISNDTTFHTTPKEGSTGTMRKKARASERVNRSGADDLAAWIGIFTVLHQMIFYSFLQGQQLDTVLHSAVRFWNVVLCTGMFAVSSSFLWQKHRSVVPALTNTWGGTALQEQPQVGNR
jgi:hypothetical protein